MSVKELEGIPCKAALRFGALAPKQLWLPNSPVFVCFLLWRRENTSHLLRPPQKRTLESLPVERGPVRVVPARIRLRHGLTAVGMRQLGISQRTTVQRLLLGLGSVLFDLTGELFAQHPLHQSCLAFPQLVSRMDLRYVPCVPWHHALPHFHWRLQLAKATFWFMS